MGGGAGMPPYCGCKDSQSQWSCWVRQQQGKGLATLLAAQEA